MSAAPAITRQKAEEAARDPDGAGADRLGEDEDPAHDRDEVGGHGGERDDLDTVADRIHNDVIVCLLHETMTPLERTLHRQNRDETVQDVRDVLHAAMAPKAQEHVEQLTGRAVLATLADCHSDPDTGVLVFLLGTRPR